MAELSVTDELLEEMRQGLADDRWLEAHPEVLEPYRGEWVVVHDRRVVAHSPDGQEAARAAPARLYPGSRILRVPTREEAAGVRIL